jgi:hypothetical protein
MNITSHESVLAALENRASCYSNRGTTCGINDNIIYWALDKTGTFDTSFLCNSNENTKQIVLVGQQERNRVTEISVPEEVLQIHGVAPANKLEGVIQIIYENINGISNWLSNNNKVEKAKEIIDKLGVEIVTYNVHCLNMQDWQNVNGFNQLFKGAEAAIQSVVGHKVHKNIGRVQKGGTSLMVIGSLME